MNKAVFLDRDGTLIEESPGYRKNPDEVKIFPGVKEAIASLRKQDYKIILVTNQSGISKGIITISDVVKVCLEIENHIGEFDRIYICPHTPEKNCVCRKPKPGMLYVGCYKLEIDPSKSYMIGDRDTDIIAASYLGIKGILTNGYDLPEKVETILSLDK